MAPPGKNNDQKGGKVAPRGEFVWAMDGKTLHPARLMIPRDENITKMTRLSEVEVQWTQTGFRQFVLHEHVEFDDKSSSGSRTQRPRRAALSSPAEEKGTSRKRTPSTSRKQNTPSSQKRKTPTRARPMPKKEKEKSKVLEVPVAAEDNSEDGKQVNNSVELPQVTKLTGEQKRSLEARDIGYDEPPAKKRKMKVIRRSITPPPLSPVDQDCKIPAVATASEVKLLQTPLIYTNEATDGAVENNAEPSVLDTFTSPLSSAKEMVVSGLLGLYKGFLGSSSPS
jgi:hypothetical protein